MHSPRSLRDGGSGSFIVVELPIEHMKKKFAVSPHTTVGDVLALVQKKIAQLRLPILSADEYGLLNPVSHGTLHPATLISDTCTVRRSPPCLRPRPRPDTLLGAHRTTSSSVELYIR